MIDQLAKELRVAEEQRAPIPPPTESHPDLSVADAYAVQQVNVDVRLAAGERIAGRKIGLTSLAMQRQLGVDSPDFGVLFDTMGVDSGGAVPADELIAPRVEFEIAFVLSADLRGPGVTNDDVLAATEGVFPTLEIIDSRVADWRITLVDTVADNASAARFIRPTTLTPVAGLDLTALTGTLELDGEVVSTGSGADVLGHPAACVAWLANTLADFGAGLRAGDVVLAGALGPSVPVRAGSRAVATIDALGTSAVTFT